MKCRHRKVSILYFFYEIYVSKYFYHIFHFTLSGNLNFYGIGFPKEIKYLELDFHCKELYLQS